MFNVGVELVVNVGYDNNDYLPILDIKLNIDQDGNIHHKLYTKPASKSITLNFHLHHPSSVKRAVVANEFKRAQLCASAEHRAEAIQATRTNLTQQLPIKLDQSPHTTPTYYKEETTHSQTNKIHFQHTLH